MENTRSPRGSVLLRTTGDRGPLANRSNSSHFAMGRGSQRVDLAGLPSGHRMRFPGVLAYRFDRVVPTRPFHDEATTMARVVVECPACKKQYPVERVALGKNATCRRCGTTFVVHPISSHSAANKEIAPVRPDVPEGASRESPRSPASSHSAGANRGRAAEWFGAGRRTALAGWRRLSGSLGGLARGLFDRLKEAGCFYLDNRSDLAWQFFEYVPMESPSYLCEIRVSALARCKDAEWNDAGWQVRLPDCCVVCGEATDGEGVEEVRTITGMAWPVLAPVGGLVAGFVLWLWWSLWFVPIAVGAGFLLGYGLRTTTDVRIRYSRCPEHADDARYPHLRSGGRVLTIRVGRQVVKRRFLAENRPDRSAGGPEPPDSSPRAPSGDRPRKAEPETIPLADEVLASVVPPDDLAWAVSPEDSPNPALQEGGEAAAEGASSGSESGSESAPDEQPEPTRLDESESAESPPAARWETALLDESDDADAPLDAIDVEPDEPESTEHP